MSVRIRLRRTGKKKQPQYRVVVADTRRARDGSFIEIVGRYNPRAAQPEVEINEERALHWLKIGALPTETVKSLLVKKGIWERFTGQAAPAAEPANAPEAE